MTGGEISDAAVVRAYLDRLSPNSRLAHGYLEPHDRKFDPDKFIGDEGAAAPTFPSQVRLTTQEVADLVRAPASTVRYWRHAGIGPRGYKVGRRVLYDQSDVEQWLEFQKQTSSRLVHD